MKSAIENGVEICTNAEVVEFSLSNESDKGPKVNGVVMKDGTRIEADVVLSNATPFHTFLELLPSDALDQESKRALRSHDYSGGAMKINCVTNALPEFTCWPTHGTIGPPHLGTIHFEDSVSQLQTAAAQAACGVPAERPLIEMAIPTSVDGTLAPAGQHVVQFFVQYTPYHLKTGNWDDLKEKYADKVFRHVERYCPGFSDSVLHRDVLSPLDLERIFGLHEGNIYHGAHRIDQIAFWRPAVGFASYRTPVKNLYMCGAGCHPGGGVMGAAGRNAASVVLRDIKHT
jgi:phytoene dehydrogenase-like protein